MALDRTHRVKRRPGCGVGLPLEPWRTLPPLQLALLPLPCARETLRDEELRVFSCTSLAGALYLSHDLGYSTVSE